MTPETPDTGSESLRDEPRGNRLDSWKEIAAYLKRDVATVRRWEKREALPVHRHLHEKLGSVFAYTAELDTWAEGRRQRLEQLPQGEATAILSQRTLPWIVSGALAFGLALVFLVWAPWRELPPPTPLRIPVDLGAGASLSNSSASQYGGSMTLSPDGTMVAFVARDSVSGILQLYLLRLSQLDQQHAVPLPAADNALTPFFSPDGRWVAFGSGRMLMKVAVSGGAAVPLADAPALRGGAWGEDGTIVFSTASDSGRRLLRISSDGGEAEPIASLAEGEVVQSWPQILPGGRVLYTSSSSTGNYNDANIVVRPLTGGAPTVVHSGFHGRYLPSGHLVYIKDGTLFAVPFDLDRLTVTGPPVSAIEGVASNLVTGGAQFATSTNGTLVYLPGPLTGAGIPIEWIDHEGKTTPLRTTPANWFSPLFSKDGLRLAMEIRADTSDIWVYDVAGDRMTRLTSDTALDINPVWTPDDRRVVFGSTRDQPATNLYWALADGTGGVERLTESSYAQRPASWHPTGKYLAFTETKSAQNIDVMILPIEGDDESGWKPGPAFAFTKTQLPEAQPMWSPNGRWLAYGSTDEAGQQQIYVRPFPGPGPVWQLTTTGALHAIWSRTTDEIFYLSNDRMMVAAFTTQGGVFRTETPRFWSPGRFQTRGPSRMFDLHPDGDRFALAPAQPINAKLDPVVMISNFFDELRRIAPATK